MTPRPAMEVTGLSQVELAWRFRARNAEALAEFLRRYEGRVIQILRKRTRYMRGVVQHADVEDAVQAAILTAYLTAARDFDDQKSSLVTWVAVLAQRHLKRLLKGHHTTLDHEPAANEPLEVQAAKSPSRRVTLIREAVKGFKGKTRKIVEAYLEAGGQPDVSHLAVRLRTTPQTVRSTWCRARHTIQQRLKRMDGNDG